MLDKTKLLRHLNNLPEHFGRRDLANLIFEIASGTFDFKRHDDGGKDHAKNETRTR